MSRYQHIYKELIGLAILLFASSANLQAMEPTKQLNINPKNSVGKVVAPITISSNPITEIVEIGNQIAITIHCNVHSAVDDLKLTIKPSQGLEMSPATIQQEYGSQPINFTLNETVNVIPQKNGRLYLNIFISGLFEGRKMIRTRTVSIQVGNKHQEKNRSLGKTKTTPNGQKIISMPAEEN